MPEVVMMNNNNYNSFFKYISAIDIAIAIIK